MNNHQSPFPDKSMGFPTFNLENWVVNPSRNTITGNNLTHQVEPRLMHVLVCLAHADGEVVSRDILLETVWNEVIVQEEALTYAISQLRRMLGDSARSPKLIETIRKTGYRLKIPVELISPDPKLSKGSPVNIKTAPSAPKNSRRFSTILSLLLVLIATMVFFQWKNAQTPNVQDQTKHQPLHQAIPLTSMPGYEITPAVSPDGSKVVFSWRKIGETTYNLHLKQRDSETVIRLTDSPGSEFYPTWSPDGTNIAFFTKKEGQWQIGIVPSLGGPVRLVSEPHLYFTGLDWAPNGQEIVFGFTDDMEKPYRLARLNMDSLEVSFITDPHILVRGDKTPRFSPDGTKIAFVRGDRSSFKDLFLIDAKGSEPKRLTEGFVNIGGLDWSTDGSTLVFAAAPDDIYNLWSLELKEPFVPRMINIQGGPKNNPSLASKTDILVFQEQSYDSNIGSVCLEEGPDGEKNFGEVIQIAPSTRIDFCARFSPSGKQILFISERSGTRELWISNSDGEQVRQLTNLGAARLRHPRWSPDGSQIVFNAAHKQFMQIFVADVASGVTRMITDQPSHHRFGTWSNDGKWIYYSIESGPAWQFWALSLFGNEKHKITTKGCLPIHESASGQLYYYKMDKKGIWSFQMPDGTETCVGSPQQIPDQDRVLLVDDGIYFVDQKPNHLELAFLDFQTDEVATLGILPATYGDHLTVSPDKSCFLFDLDDYIGSDLMMLEQWR
ncbi:MAG: hypothetical protein GY780_07165 [bacterium]|nr:hypothetical protein [bacterium]